MLSVRRLMISLVLVGVACAPTPSVWAFCEEAVPVLSREDLGGDPAAMRQQMDDLSEAADLLPDDQSIDLQAQLDALNAELALALQGQAENGWSSVEVVETVGSLCGDDDLIGYIVQP